MPTVTLFILFFVLSVAFARIPSSEVVPKSRNQGINPTHVSKALLDLEGRLNVNIKLESLQGSHVVLAGNSTVLSVNKTFKLGFFSTGDGEDKWYLGIWYASIPTPTYVWVANRQNPIKNVSSASLEFTEDGKLAVKEYSGTILWQTNNVEKASKGGLLEQGNLVLYNDDGRQVWQSFDYPTDTWLPGMNLTAEQWLTCWKSSTDPSPGKYSLRLRPPGYGELALVYSDDVSNATYIYWSTGNWTGNAFTGVPEMTVPYIYSFHFDKPFTTMASFGYNEVSLEAGSSPPLTRFFLDYTGQLKQFTWSLQTEYWNMFWSQPENLCRVYALCGNIGFCNSKLLSPCRCLNGLKPVNQNSWDAGDFSSGCRRESGDLCGKNDGFEEAGVVSYEGAVVLPFTATRSVCEKTCLVNCSCIGLQHSEKSNLCKNLYGSLLNLRNLSDSTIEETLYLRVPRSSTKEKNRAKLALIEAMCGCLAILIVGVPVVLLLRSRRIRKRKEEEESVFPVTNLKVFSYKELHAATKGFSEKLGHGGFGAVFQGELSDSTLVAVKRLEKPDGGEKEFRAEVCTIGNIQHVNLVRLRGFCSEDSHRLLVYDFMPNGPLSSFLRRDGKNLSWDVRFRIAIGTARGLAYLHEECRNCILHCDIKPENILLDEDFSAKVSDFGLAKLVGRDFSRVLVSMRGTWGYVAPEWISGVAITTKADVYSYGMTLLELLGGRRNVEGPPSAGGGVGGGTEKWFFPPWAASQIIDGNVAAVVDQRLGNIYNQAEAERAGFVAVWCIQDDESMRPTMGMVVKMLEGVVEVTIPPPPKLLQALVSGESFQGIADNSSSKVSNDDSRSSGDNVQLSQDSKGSKLSIPMRTIAPRHHGSCYFLAGEYKEEHVWQRLSSTKTSENKNKKKTHTHTISPQISRKDNQIQQRKENGLSELSAKIEHKGDEKGEGSDGSPSKKSSSSSPQKLLVLEIESPFLEEPVDLHEAPSTVLVNGAVGGDYPPLRSFEDARNLFYIESGKLWSIAAPIAFNILCNYGINSFTSIFVGHLGDVELSAVAISLSVIANFSFGFLLGMSSALETLCGQAYGAGQVEMLGIYMQRSWIILIVACFSLLPLYVYSKPVLKVLGQRDDIADMAGTFSIQIIPQMFSLAINFSTQKFLQAQSKVGILAWVGFVALIVHILVLYIFMGVFKWGTAGAAAAYDISGWIISLAQLAYIVGWCKDSWRGLSWLAFREIWSFVRLSIASAVMLCLEIWYFMSIIVLTGHLEDPIVAVGSLSICMNLNGWEGMLFIGINAAVSVRVSNELGSEHPRAAKYSVFVTVAQSLFIGILSMLGIMATKNHFAILFTSSEKMQKAVSELAYLLAATLVLNSVQPVISGVAVGGGWQGLVAYVNLACYYVIGLPLGFLLGYKAELGVQGIWMGMIFGTFLQTLILCYIVWKTNWNEEVAQASERMRMWGGATEEFELG